jgi:C4-dicarboxylate-specific signal transduction histidine kinase
MNEEQSRLLREQGLSFFGTVTASLSHEINNVTAIIGELSGLLNDLLLGAERGRPPDHEKLRNLSEKITGQVNKGKSIIKRLNRFAHSIDEPDTAFDARELLEEITDLAQRFAFLRGVHLETASTGEPIAVRGNSFSLQQAIFICIELALAGSEKGDVVTLTLNQEGAGAQLCIERVHLVRTEEVDSRLFLISMLMKELGGTAEVLSSDDGRHSLILTIPGATPARGH